MSGRSEREQGGSGPPKEHRDRVREERAHPAEVSFYVAVAEETRVSLGAEGAGEEDREQQEDDSANLAGERRLRGSIVPVPARAL